MPRGFNVNNGENKVKYTLLKGITEELGEIPVCFVKSHKTKFDDYNELSIEIPNKVYSNKTGKFVDIKIFDLFLGKWQNIISDVNGDKDRFVVTNCEEEDKVYRINNEKVKYKLKKITCKSYSYTLSKKTIEIADDTCGQLYHGGGYVGSSKGGVTIARQDDADGFLELFQEVGYTIDHIDNNARYEESNVKTKYTVEVANELVLDNIQRGSTIFNVDTNIECKDNNTVELNVDYLHFLRKDNSGKLYDDMTILENKLGHIYMNITHIRAVYTSCQKYSDCIRYYITLKDGTVLEKDCECPYLVGLTLNVKDIKLQYTNGDMSVENILKYRILEKGTYSYLAIIQDFIEKAFNTVVIFDDVNFKISVYDRATYGARTGIEFSYDTFVKSINKNKLYDNIINKLIVEGENASIINENPLGTNYIYNFDYHEKYGLMSDGLLSAWHTYKTIVSQNGTALHDAREDLKNYNNRIIQLQAMIIQSKYQLNNYNIQLSSLLQNNKDGQFNDQISELNSKIQNENNKLNDLNSRLSLNETEKTSVQLKIKELCDKVSVENATDSDGNKIFTDNLLKEFKALIVEERLQDSFYDTNVGLMEYSTNYIAEKNKLDIEYTINNKEIIANMHIPEGLSWNYYFSVGNFVEVKDILVDGDYTKEEARVIEIDYNPYKNQIKSMTHSTKDEKYDELNNVQSISESISRSNTYINSYKPYWEMSEDMADKLARLEEMIAANGGSISGVSANGTIGGSGMDIAKYDTIMARLAAFDEIFAGNITADMIQAGAIIADKIASHSITADKIATDVLKASNIQFDTASGNVMDLQTLLAQFGLFSNEQVLHLTAENVVLDEAIIKDAMIDSLDANKLLSGEIDTAKIRIHGKDGRLSIVDNTLQIEDENHVVRLQLGLDATGGYSFNIWNEDGTLQWTSKGLTSEGMQPEIIRDIHVADDANINGHKIDINTLVENFNDNCTKTLSSTKISMGGQTLEAYLQSMTQTIEGTAGGGKNILLNSQLFVDDNWTENNFTKVRLQDPEDNVNYIKAENTSGQIAFTEYIPANVFKYMDKFYTFSVYIYGERGKSVRIGSRTKYLEYKFGKDGWERLHFTFFIRGISDDTVTFQDGKFMFTEDELCLYQENNKYDGYPLVDENTVCIQFLNDGLYKFKKPQLEIGMAASAYSLCPDDTIDAIETNKAAIKIEKDRMDQLLAKTTITKKNGEVVGIEDSYNETIRTIDTLETMIADNKTLIDENTNNVKAVRNISNYTKDTLDMFLKVLTDNNITFENAIKTTKTNTNMIEMLKNGTQFKVTESIVKELLQGTEYREVSTVYPEYYFSDSSSTLSSGNWSTEYQQWQDGKYIWGRTIAQYKDGSINIGEPKMIFTATAKRIESISLLYYVSSSNAELTEGEWKQSCPEWEYGKYLWTKFKIVYKTDEEVITKETEPVLEYSWLPSQQLQTSNGNLLLNTQLKDDSNWVATDCTKDITLANISTMNISSVDKGCIKYQPATVCSTKGDYVFSAYLQGNSGNKIKLIICNDNTEDNSTCNIIKTFTLKNSAFNRLILPFHIKSSDEVITENSIYEINDDKNYDIDDSFIKIPVIDKKDKLTVKIQFVNSGDYKFKMPQLEYGITATDYRPNSKDLLDTLEKHETQININTNGISTLVSSQKDMQKSISTLEQTSDSFKTKIEANKKNITDMGSKVTNNTSEITQLKDKIELKIDETTVETMINNIEVGTRNLLVKKDLQNGYLNKITGDLISSNDYNKTTDYIYVKDYNYITVTLYDSFTLPDDYATNQCIFYDKDKNYISENVSSFKFNEPSFKTIKIPDESYYTRLTLIYGNTIKYKIEKGNISTDYSEAQEDIEERNNENIGKTVASTVTEYYVSTSNTSCTGGSWSTDSPTWSAGKYIWSRNKTTLRNGTVKYSNPVCIQGAKGQDGTNGTPGKDGKDGRTTYFHVKYSNDNGKTFTSNNGEDVGTYIGTYVDYTEADSTKVSDYTWIKIQGKDGKDGTNGTPGKDGKDGVNGKTTYFHVKYSANADGKDMSETPNTYIGTYVDYTEADSDDYKKYTWCKFQGTDGIPGKNGTNGQTSYLHIKYSNDGGSTFTSNNGEDPGNYIGQYTDFTQADSTDVKKYTWAKIKGTDGIPGTNGTNGQTSYLHIKYSNDGGKTFTSNSGEDVGTYLGQYTDFIKEDSTDVKKYTWAKIKGEQGVQGSKGADGKQLYTWLKYADSPTSGMSDSPDGKKYIGLAYNKVSSTESSNYSDYSWSLIKGADGTNGTPGKDGKDGKDGKTTYFHVKYSNDEGKTFTSNNGEDIGTYIGTYVDYTESDSTDVSKYAWVKIQGTDGIAGKNGTNGQTSYLHIKYSNDGGKTFTSNSGEDVGLYLGQYTDFTKADSTDVTKYTWAKIKGEQGVPGAKGADGKQYYTWIKYATDNKGSNMSDDPSGKSYIGLAYNKTTATESTTASDYTWSLIKGSDGSDGLGIKSVEAEYYLSTSKTSQTGGSWVTTCPTWEYGKYLWTRSKITYTDNTTEYTKPMVDSSWEAVNLVEVGGRNLLVKKDLQNGYLNKITGDLISSNDYNKTTDYIYVKDYNYITVTLYDSFTLPDDYATNQCIFYDKDKNYISENVSSFKFNEPSFKTIKIPDESYYTRLTLIYGNTIKYKIEKGNISTDWTPAPEDTEEQIQKVTETVTKVSNETKITKESLDNLISKTTITKEDGTVVKLEDSYSDLYKDAYGLKSTVSDMKTQIESNTEKVSTAQSSINQLSTEITNKVTKADVENMISAGMGKYKGDTNRLKMALFSQDILEKGEYYKAYKQRGTSDINSEITVNNEYQIDGISSLKMGNSGVYDYPNRIGIEFKSIDVSKIGNEYPSISAYVMPRTFTDSEIEIGFKFYNANGSENNEILTNMYYTVKDSYDISKRTLKNNDWNRIYFATDEVLSDYGITRIVPYIYAITPSSCFYVCKPQAELLNEEQIDSGEYIHDWTLGINDMWELFSRVDSAEQKITPTAIVSTVTTSKTYKNDLGTKVDTSTYNSYVSQTATEISSKVAKNEFGSMIKQNADSVKYSFGELSNGENLVRNGACTFGTRNWGWFSDSSNASFGIGTWSNEKHFMIAANNSSCTEERTVGQRVPVKSNTTYTLSYYRYADNGITSFDVLIGGGIENSYNWAYSRIVEDSSTDTSIKRIKYTFTTHSDETWVYIRFDNNGWKNGDYHSLVFWKVKLEEGDKATPFCEYTADGDQITEFTGNGIRVYHPEDSSGDYSEMSAGGFVHHVGSNDHYYYSLFTSGRVVTNASSTNPVTITLPSEFIGKNPKIVLALWDTASNPGAKQVVTKITYYVQNWDNGSSGVDSNGKFNLIGYIMYSNCTNNYWMSKIGVQWYAFA